MKQQTCDQRIDESLASRLEDIRLMLAPKVEDCGLTDPDEPDETKITLGDSETDLVDPTAYMLTYGGDLVEYLDLEGGGEFDALRDAQSEAFHEYGLCFDYVEAGTFEGQREGYFRYQLSCGGPSEEFRFYVDAGGSLHRVEFWFLDWFDGASRDVTQDETVQMLADYFEGACMFEVPMYE